MSVQFNFYVDIIGVIDKHIQEICIENYSKDDCPPIFKTSIFTDDKKNDIIMVSCEHLGYNYSDKIFPREDSYWGYNTIEDMLANLYNRTM